MRLCKIVQVGFGSLGKEIFVALQNRKNFKLVSVIDIDKNKIGKDAGILAVNKRSGIKVVSHISTVKSKPDVAIHTTISSINDAFDQISELLKHRINVISSCEQLVYPYGSNTSMAKRLDILAKKHKVSFIGVGINPGFMMDSLVLMLTSLCSKIDCIRVERVVDILNRRETLQKKMCLGFTLEQFEKIKTKNNVGHVGFQESARMICDKLNVRMPTFAITIKPDITKHVFQSSSITLEPGQVAGMEHTLVVKKLKSKFLEMKLNMFAGAREFDLVKIEGIPTICVSTNGINGDQATVALLLNYIPIILGAEPGLHTVNDLHIPSASL